MRDENIRGHRSVNQSSPKPLRTGNVWQSDSLHWILMMKLWSDTHVTRETPGCERGLGHGPSTEEGCRVEAGSRASQCCWSFGDSTASPRGQRCSYRTALLAFSLVPVLFSFLVLPRLLFILYWNHTTFPFISFSSFFHFLVCLWITFKKLYWIWNTSNVWTALKMFDSGDLYR